MTALKPIPTREDMQAVLMIRTGLGWTVGVGGVLAGTITSRARRCLDDKEATAAAVALSDELDLMALRSDPRR